MVISVGQIHLCTTLYPSHWKRGVKVHSDGDQWREPHYIVASHGRKGTYESFQFSESLARVQGNGESAFPEITSGNQSYRKKLAGSGRKGGVIGVMLVSVTMYGRKPMTSSTRFSTPPCLFPGTSENSSAQKSKSNPPFVARTPLQLQLVG